VIDYAPPNPDRDAMLTKVRAELRAEHGRLTDEQIDLIADVAIELRIVRDSISRHAVAVLDRGRDHSRGVLSADDTVPSGRG
jgi:hypothetical protein